MRFLSLLLLLPGVAFAAQPGTGGQMDPQQFFDQTKQMMLPMIEETLPVMKETRSCLQGADSQDDLKACAEAMAKLQEKMRSRMGAPGAMHGGPGAMPGEAPPMRDPEEIEWNEQSKQNMLMFLDQSILMGQAMKDCLNQSGGMEQMQQCMQSKQPRP